MLIMRSFCPSCRPRRDVCIPCDLVSCTTASKVFISEIISDERKMLAVYPVFFFYTFISWMIVIH